MKYFGLKDPDCKVPYLKPITKYRSIQQSGFHDSQCSRSPGLDPQDDALVRCAAQTRGGRPEDFEGLIPFSHFHLIDSLFHTFKLHLSSRLSKEAANFAGEGDPVLVLERADSVDENLKD